MKNDWSYFSNCVIFTSNSYETIINYENYKNKKKPVTTHLCLLENNLVIQKFFGISHIRNGRALFFVTLAKKWIKLRVGSA